MQIYIFYGKNVSFVLKNITNVKKSKIETVLFLPYKKRLHLPLFASKNGKINRQIVEAICLFYSVYL